MIDWMFSPDEPVPDKKYTWLDCEKTMYQELFGAPFPGVEAMNSAKTTEFNRRAVERCWRVIHDSAKAAKPDCIVWLSCYDLQHPQMKGCSMLQEVDWVMNEHFDPAKLEAVKSAVGPKTKLIQCICGWGDQHNADKILHDPHFAEFGVYGYAKPDPTTTLPPEDGSANAKNIAAMRKILQCGKVGRAPNPRTCTGDTEISGECHSSLSACRQIHQSVSVAFSTQGRWRLAFATATNFRSDLSKAANSVSSGNSSKSSLPPPRE